MEIKGVVLRVESGRYLLDLQIDEPEDRFMEVDGLDATFYRNVNIIGVSDGGQVIINDVNGEKSVKVEFVPARLIIDET